MRTFVDEACGRWVATAREEATPRHHGRWHLVFHPEEDAGTELPMAEVRWQSQHSAERTLRTMSETELRRRLAIVRLRAGLDDEPAARSA